MLSQATRTVWRAAEAPMIAIKNRWYLVTCRPDSDSISTSRMLSDLALDSLQTTIDAQNQAGLSLAKVIRYTF